MQSTLAPNVRRPKGEECSPTLVLPDVDRERAGRVAALGRALGDPIRIGLLDVLRTHAGRVCVCDLVPLFDVSQPTISHHLRVLREAGLVESEKQGLWAYYHVLPAGLDELAGWLGEA